MNMNELESAKRRALNLLDTWNNITRFDEMDDYEDGGPMDLEDQLEYALNAAFPEGPKHGT